MSLVDNLIAQFQDQQQRANDANMQRYQQGLDILDRRIEMEGQEGTFMKATEAGLARGKSQAVASGTQSLVSSGLASTTQAAGLGKKYEEEVGAPTRLKAADISAQRLSQSLMDKVGFIERREDVGPSYGDIAGLAKSIGAGSAARTSSGPRRAGTGKLINPANSVPHVTMFQQMFGSHGLDGGGGAFAKRMGV
jgi:hypothetical protein